MIYETIGFLELNSIAKGIEAADAMLKAAEVTLLSAKPSCPGKYHVLIHGEVAAVTSSIKAGVKVGGSHVIEKTVIPRVHPQVIEAINLATPMYQGGSSCRRFQRNAGGLCSHTQPQRRDIQSSNVIGLF